jgi:hypothetical protein
MSNNLSTGEISDRLGFKLTAPFITQTLGVAETEKIKAGHYWSEEGYRQILYRLAERIKGLYDGKAVPAAAEPMRRQTKKKDEPAADPFAGQADPFGGAADPFGGAADPFA